VTRTEYAGLLRLPYGYHTGSGRALSGPDSPLFRDHEGRLELSGSALAGLLRADMERLSRAQGEVCLGRVGECDPPREDRVPSKCRCRVCRLMGPRAGRGARAEGAEGLHASRLYVSGDHAAASPGSRIRDHVGIDRRSGAAASERKYDVELVDAQIEFPFRLRLDAVEQLDDARRLLEATLHRLVRGWLFAGGRRASGQGLARLVSLTRTEVDLADRGHLIAYLLGDGLSAVGTPLALVDGDKDDLLPDPGPPPLLHGEGPERAGAAPVAWGQLRLGLVLRFSLPVLVNDPAEAARTGWDHSHVRRSDGLPILPGSSVRGVLRSRVEQILRSLDGFACDLHRRSEACHERLDPPPVAGEDETDQPQRCGLEKEYEGMCLACRLFGCGRLASSVRVTDFHAVEEGRALGQDFVAVDRFTGGTAPGAKFDARGQTGVTFAGQLHVDLGDDRDAGTGVGPVGLGLLALAIRDLLLGDLAIGSGTAKGFGEHRTTIESAAWYWLRRPPAFGGHDGASGAIEEGEWPPPGPDGSPPGGVSTPAEARSALGGWAARLEEWVRTATEAAAERPGAPERVA